MAQGRLYEVDMRLRPSGRKGPVATAFSAFCNYQQNEAWGWEHLALTRARPVAGTLAICTAVDKFRTGLLSGLADPAKALADLADMRTRLDAARPRRTPWDVKDGPGAIRDLELFAQAAALASGSPARTTADQLGLAAQLGWVSAEELTGLVGAYDLMWSVVAAERLLIAGDFDAEVIGQGGRDFIVSGTPFDSADALAQALETTYQSVAAIVDRVAAVPEVREET
jgi:glutamate-ammonia-ligase adenylyltransferase